MVLVPELTTHTETEIVSSVVLLAKWISMSLALLVTDAVFPCSSPYWFRV